MLNKIMLLFAFAPLTFMEDTTTWSPTPASSCPGESKNNLTWPKTDIGTYTYPKEYCFEEDTTRLRRYCSFIGQWEEINSTCSVAPFTSYTQKIIDFNNNRTLFHEILKKYEGFGSLDVYVSASEWMSVYDNKTMLADVFDNILHINATVLEEAQEKMSACDMWLRHFTMADDFAEKRSTFSSIKIDYNNSGVLVSKTNDCSVITDTTNIFSQDFYWGFYTTMNCYACYVIIFFDTRLSPGANNLSIAFSTKLSFIKDKSLLEQVIILRKIEDNLLTNDVQCISWKNRWVNTGIFTINGNNFVCTFEPNDYCYAILIEQPYTKTLSDCLSDILNSNLTAAETLARTLLLSYRYKEFNSIDLYLTGQILKKISNASDCSLENINQIVTNIQKIDPNVLKQSQDLDQATDTILYYIDAIVSNYSHQNLTTVLVTSENFSILKCNLSLFWGVAVLENRTIVLLDNTSTIENLIRDFSNLNSALIINSFFKDQFEENEFISVMIFFEDRLFNQRGTAKQYGKISVIFDILLPVTNFSYPLSILYNGTTIKNNFCSFWNFSVTDYTASYWQYNDHSKNNSTLIQCDFNHTTHFALLILDEDDYKDDYGLSLVTNISLSFSVFGFVGIFLTSLLFSSWRQKTGNQVLLHFVASGTLFIMAYYVSSVFLGNNTFCIITGAMLHYSILSQFSWMLSIAVLQFRRFVIVLGTYTEHILLKCCLFAWGWPLIPVSLVLIIDVSSYTSSKVGLCYPSGYSLYLGIWLPLGLIVLINTIIFMYVIHAVAFRKSKCVTFGGNEAIYQWRLVFFLFFLLGITWIFGFFAEIMGSGIVFEYLFCVLAGIQGFIMFLFFIMLNKNVRELYRKFVKCKSGK